MSFFGDVGTFLGDVFTGRWTGGETNVVQDIQQDPWVLAAPAAAIAAPFAGPALAAGAEGLGGLFGAATVAEAAPAAMGFVPEAGLESALSSELAAGLPGTATSGISGVSTMGPATAEVLGETTIPSTATLTAGDATALPMGGAGGTAPSALGDLPIPSVGNMNMGGLPTPASSGGGVPGFLDTLTSPSQWTLGGVAQTVGAGAAGSMLLGNLIKGSSMGPNQTQMSNIAGFTEAQIAPITAEAQQLQSYLLTSTLPPSMQAGIQQVIQNQKAKITQAYANRGAPTAAGTNSSLDADLAAVDRQGLIMAGQMQATLFEQGTKLMQTALNEAGLSSELYKSLAQMDRT